VMLFIQIDTKHDLECCSDGGAVQGPAMVRARQ